MSLKLLDNIKTRTRIMAPEQLERKLQARKLPNQSKHFSFIVQIIVDNICTIVLALKETNLYQKVKN